MRSMLRISSLVRALGIAIAAMLPAGLSRRLGLRVAAVHPAGPGPAHGADAIVVGRVAGRRAARLGLAVQLEEGQPEVLTTTCRGLARLLDVRVSAFVPTRNGGRLKLAVCRGTAGSVCALRLT